MSLRCVGGRGEGLSGKNSVPKHLSLRSASLGSKGQGRPLPEPWCTCMKALIFLMPGTSFFLLPFLPCLVPLGRCELSTAPQTTKLSLTTCRPWLLGNWLQSISKPLSSRQWAGWCLQSIVIASRLSGVCGSLLPATPPLLLLLIFSLC